MTEPALSLVIPAYNSAGYVSANVLRVRDFYAQAGIDGEIIVVDDGSTDGTADSIVQTDRIRVVRVPHGGKGAALRAGMATTTGAICGFTDADLPYGTD